MNTLRRIPLLLCVVALAVLPGTTVLLIRWDTAPEVLT